MEKIIVTISGFITIIGILWFFFGKKSGEAGSTEEKAKNTWDIIVNGGYKPDTIFIHHDKPATLTFTRTDSNTCLEEVVLPDFKIKEYLPLNQPITIPLPPHTKGVFGFYCGMNMFHGRIQVV